MNAAPGSKRGALAALADAWDARARSALPADAMLINKQTRELREALAAPAEGDGAVDYVPGRLDREAPPRVWLQIDSTGDNDERDESWPGSEHVTWQDESIGGLEIQYVRADLARPSPTAQASAGVALATVKGIVAKYVGRTSRIYLYIVGDLAKAQHALAQQPAAVEEGYPTRSAPPAHGGCERCSRCFEGDFARCKNRQYAAQVSQEHRP